MLTRTIDRLKKFNEEEPRFVGYCTGVVLMTVAWAVVDRLIVNSQEAAGFMTVRLYKESETGDILVENINGTVFKAEFPAEES